MSTLEDVPTLPALQVRCQRVEGGPGDDAGAFRNANSIVSLQPLLAPYPYFRGLMGTTKGQPDSVLTRGLHPVKLPNIFNSKN